MGWWQQNQEQQKPFLFPTLQLKSNKYCYKKEGIGVTLVKRGYLSKHNWKWQEIVVLHSIACVFFMFKWNFVILGVPKIIVFCSILCLRNDTMAIRNWHFAVTASLGLPCLFTIYTRPLWSLFPIVTVSQYALSFSKQYPMVALALLKIHSATFLELE